MENRKRITIEEFKKMIEYIEKSRGVLIPTIENVSLCTERLEVYDGTFYSDGEVIKNIAFPMVKFLNCDFSGCKFFTSTVSNIEFEDCDMDATTFEYCNVESSNFINCKGSFIEFELCDLSNVSFYRCNIELKGQYCRTDGIHTDNPNLMDFE